MAKQKKLVLTSLEDLKAWQEAKKVLHESQKDNSEKDKSKA